jgi:hypothetical protein
MIIREFLAESLSQTYFSTLRRGLEARLPQTSTEDVPSLTECGVHSVECQCGVDSGEWPASVCSVLVGPGLDNSI